MLTTAESSWRRSSARRCRYCAAFRCGGKGGHVGLLVVEHLDDLLPGDHLLHVGVQLTETGLLARIKVKSFEYDEERACWIRKEDGKAFELLEKDADDLVRISEITDH